MSDRSDTQGFDKMLHTHEYFFKLFDTLEGVMCETRTKAHDISTLISYAEQYGAPKNIEVAYSLNPQSLITEHEQSTASLDRRIENINTLLQL
jgi:DNA repair photolyase